MDSPGAIGRRRGNTKVSAEDQALDQIAKEVSERCAETEYKFNRVNKTFKTVEIKSISILGFSFGLAN